MDASTEAQGAHPKRGVPLSLFLGLALINLGIASVGYPQFDAMRDGTASVTAALSAVTTWFGVALFVLGVVLTVVGLVPARRERRAV